eukprot:CAMPEP_0177325740 /NCGR_PEP_ID=MMETSP0368-20130122/17969_1 /TAXON_ID=447022 ORGANISM="Scrippsiella hangoei-like, Strain SHHI-4" /NCGR_SAMPLE_ID=MMETSP0368 /ASSEMBLY_ACC=CAM_ASM_000363 /LENGTH=109 /DNA_ID=CAMNT_0018785657 /DNA_START=427 /DNA_END=753 /DNA_ORIENTATION=-
MGHTSGKLLMSEGRSHHAEDILRSARWFPPWNCCVARQEQELSLSRDVHQQICKVTWKHIQEQHKGEPKQCTELSAALEHSQEHGPNVHGRCPADLPLQRDCAKMHGPA